MIYIYIFMILYYIVGISYFAYIHVNKKKYNYMLIYFDNPNDNEHLSNEENIDPEESFEETRLLI